MTQGLAMPMKTLALHYPIIPVLLQCLINIKPGDKEKIDDPCSAHQIKIVTPQKPPTLEKAGIPHKTA